MPAVVGDIPRELVRPESPVALGGGGVLASLVPVPEAPVHKDHGPVFGQGDIRLAGEGGNMEPEAMARAMEQRAHGAFRAGVLALDFRH